MSDKAYVHFVHEDRGLIAKRAMSMVPRVGDVRMAGEKYYKVTLVVWVLDEPDCPFSERVNIGLVDDEVRE